MNPRLKVLSFASALALAACATAPVAPDAPIAAPQDVSPEEQ